MDCTEGRRRQSDSDKELKNCIWKILTCCTDMEMQYGATTGVALLSFVAHLDRNSVSKV
jgi:hypothetical protein